MTKLIGSWVSSVISSVARRVWILWIAIVVALATVGTGIVLLWPADDEGLTGQQPEITYGGAVMSRDGKFTIGLLTLDHPGQDITVLKVESLTSPNIEYLGAFITLPRDFADNGVSVVPGFPSKFITAQRPLSEFVPAAETSFVTPKNTDGKPSPLQVLAGFRLVSGEIGAVNGIRVVYRVGNKTMSEVFRHAAIVCVPACAKRPDWKQDDFSERTLRRFNLLPDGD